jgi:hypothetical protein
MKMFKKKKDGDPKKALMASVKIKKSNPIKIGGLKNNPSQSTQMLKTTPFVKSAIKKTESQRGNMIERSNPNCKPPNSKKTKPSPPLA